MPSLDDRYSVNAICDAIDAVSHEIECRGSGLGISATPKSENVLWRRLVECILGSQVQNRTMMETVQWLERLRLLDVEASRYAGSYRNRLKSALMRVNAGGRIYSYRFYNAKARQISQAYDILYLKNDGIVGFLGSLDPCNARRKLIAAIPGLGPKQASLYLRNIGVSRDLLIIDAHLVRFINKSKIASISGGVTSIARYEQIELRYKKYFSHLGRSLASVDFATWIVMREASRT